MAEGRVTLSINTTATYNKSIHVKTEADKKTCRIQDSAILSPDRMVVSDAANMNVKLINTSSGTVISTFPTSCPPQGVTVLSINMIVVTLSKEGNILLLTNHFQLTFEREIKVKKECLGIAYKDDKLAVSYTKPGRVNIIDLQGKVLHTIQPTKGEDEVLISPLYILFGQEPDTVIVSDYKTNTVSVITFGGQILRSYTHDSLDGPSGIVLTDDGLLYLGSLGNGCVHAVSADFTTSKMLIIDDENVMLPQSIAYCDTSNKLYISNGNVGDGEDNSNNLQVYTLNV